jgi:hypothetical protein
MLGSSQLHSRSLLRSRIKNVHTAVARVWQPPVRKVLGSSQTTASLSVQAEGDQQLQRVCQNVLVGVAAAAAWSVLASAVSGTAAPFASMSLATSGSGSSGETNWTLQQRTAVHAAVPSTLHASAASCYCSCAMCCMPISCCCCCNTGAGLAAQSAYAGLAAGFLHTLCGPDHLAVSAARTHTC